MLLGEYMATQQNITVGINVTTNGTGTKAIKEAQTLHSEYKSAAKAAASINAGGTSGGTSGSRAVAAAAAPGGKPVQEYGTQRGAAGMTGASARDFANQAQGLGGIVRLYATYAANVFAVGAAYRALSSAMDTTNMVRGLDQLGAASGVALGSLSKRLVEATDEAISLREAMEATTKAVSSGMNSDNVLRMGKVAKQAAQALGVDMADAVSRISRGITKLEPELLDELGIFTRIDPAVQAYAKSVGRAASSLTDFERRMAFANAVLEEGERKFGEIDIDTNPYTKLLASVKDLAQQGLELVNKVVAPLVGYLSSSPAALTATIAGLATVLLKQALPAIGEFKAGLASAAEAATELSIRKAEDAAVARSKLDAQVLADVELLAEAKVSKVDETEQRVLALEKSGIDKRSAAYKLLQKDIFEVTEADYAAVEARAKAAEKSGRDDVAKGYRETIIAVKEHRAAEEDLINTKKSLYDANIKAAEGYGVYGTTVRAATNAQISATKATIVSNAAYNGSLIGITGSLDLMRKEIAESNLQLTGMQRTTLMARGAFAAVGGAVTTLMNSIGTIGMVIGAAVAAFAFLDSAMSKNAEKVKELSKGLDRTDSSIKNLGNTLDFINKKPFLEQMSIQSMTSMSAAIREVADSLKDATDSLLAADKAAGGWDRFIDGWKSLWGGDLASKFAESTSKALFGSLTKLSGTKEGKELQNELAKILNLDPDKLTLSALDDAIKNTAKTAPENLKKVQQAYDNIAKAAQISAAKGNELVSSFAKTSDLFKQVENSFTPKDNMTQYGQSLIDSFSKLSLALEDPKQKLNAIRVLAEQIQNIPGTPLTEALKLKELAKDAEEAQVAQAKLLKVNQDMIAKEAELAELIGSAEKARRIALGDKNVQVSGLTGEGIKSLRELRKDLDALKDQKNINVKIVADVTSKINASTKEIEAAQIRVFSKGADIVAKQLSAEWAKAGSVISGAYANILSGTAAGLELKARSDTAVIQAQIAQIDSQRELTIATRELAIQMKQEELETAKRSSYGGEGNRAGLGKIQQELDLMRRDLSAAKSGNTKGLYSNLSASLAGSGGKQSEIATEGLRFAQNMESSAAAVSALRAQITAINITLKDSTLVLEEQNKIKALQTDGKELEQKQQALDLIKDAVGETNLLYVQERQLFEQKRLSLSQAVEEAQLKTDILRFEQILADPKASADVKKKTEKELELKRALLAEYINEGKAQQTLNQTISQAIELVNTRYKIEIENINKKSERSSKLIDDQKTELDFAKTLLVVSKTSGAISEKAYNSKKLAIDTQLLELEYQQETLNARTQADTLLAEIIRKENSLTAAIKARGDGAEATKAETAAAADLQAQRERVNSSLSNSITLYDIKKQRAAEILNLTHQNEEAQERWNSSIERMTDFTSSLKDVFGDIGEAIGKTAEAVLLLSNNQEKYGVLIADAEKNVKFEQDWANAISDKGEKTKELTDAEDNLSRLKKKGQIEELKGVSQTAGAAKKMFKEKTFAFKVLASIEKATAIQSMALQAQQAAATLASIPGKIAGGVAELFKQGGWAGFVGAAAFLAMMASLGFGGGKGSSAKQIGAAERQETQGTAMGYDEMGNKVQTSRGVFGDTDAKSESIANSLEIIKDNSREGLSYDNKMLKTLEDISYGIQGLAKNLYGVGGIRRGSAFGTMEGQIAKGGGFLGTGLFGSKTSASITDSGLILGGNFNQLAAGQGLSQFEDVQYTKKKWYGSKKSWMVRQYQTVSEETSDFFADIFSNAKDLFLEIGARVGKSSNEIINALNSLTVSQTISLRGLKGEDFERELSAIIGSMLDEGAYTIFKEFERFAEFGEGMLETVVRVVDTNEKVRLSLQTVLDRDIGQYSFDTSEALVKLAGGIEEFFEKLDFYADNFITKAEKLAPVQRAVTEELTRLEFGSVNTMQEFKALVESLDLTTTYGQETYTALMNLAPGFIQVVDKISDLDSLFQNMADKKLSGGSAEDFFKTFYTAEQQVEFLAESVKNKFTKAATTAGFALMQMPESMDKYRDLVEWLDAGTNAAGPGALEFRNTLIDMGPAFAELMKAISEKSVEELLAEAKARVRSNQDIANSILNLQKETKKLEAELLDAKGYTQEAKDAFRALAIEGFTAAEIAIYDYNEALRDQIAQLRKESSERINLEKRLLEVQGETSTLRAQELQALEPSNRSLQERIWNLEKEAEIEAKRVNELKTLEDQLLQAMGDTATLRQRELDTLEESNQDMQRRIWALEAENQIVEERKNLDQQILQLLGDTTTIRAQELAQLDHSNRALQERIWALEEENAIASEKENLERRILELLDDTATIRQQELAALYPVNQELQLRIWALEDERKAAEDATNAEKELADARKSLIEQVIQLKGSEQQIKDYQRSQALQEIDSVDLRNLQKYIYSLEDVKEAEEKLNNARQKFLQKSRDLASQQVDALKQTTDALKGFITNLTNLRNSLLLGEESILTPEAKYQESRSQLDKVIAGIQTTGTSPDEVKARENAMSQLDSVTRSFLAASKEVNASSSQYVSDFNFIQNVLDTTAGALATQLTIEEQALNVAERQFTLLESQLSALEGIEDTIETLEASLLSATTNLSNAITYAVVSSASLSTQDRDAIIAATGIRAYARGGLASGVSLVGEEGPEIVDFATPGRVYTADQTAGMFTQANAQQELVDEVRKLRKEVEHLRVQQREETGHLINATFASQTQNAEEIAEAVTTATKTQTWTMQSAQKATLI
jgi:hypothetical protein